MNQGDHVIPKPEGVEFLIVMHNAFAQTADAAKRWFTRLQRFHVHFSPAEVASKRIGRGVIRFVLALKIVVDDDRGERNKNSISCKKAATSDLILRNFKTVCERISDSGHE